MTGKGHKKNSPAMAVLLLLVGSLFGRPSLTISQLIQLKRMDFHCLLGRSEAEPIVVVADDRVGVAAERRSAIPRTEVPATAAEHAARPC